MASLSNRVITVYNHKTSIRLAPAEWEAIDAICKRENISRKTLFELIALNKDEKLGLTSSIRLFSIAYYKNFILGKITQTNPIVDAIKEIA